MGVGMLLEHEVKKLIHELDQEEVAKIYLEGSNITVQSFENGKKISLSTPVYFGGNYIPKSVRNCLTKRAPFDSYSLRTTLNVDEENYRIDLKYVGNLLGMNEMHIVYVLEGFSNLAARWRDYLDEHDQNDLVRIQIR